MANFLTNELNKFRVLNKVANCGGTVIIGSSFFQSVPVNELKQTYNVSCNLYNRSISDLTISAATELVTMTLSELKPNRILLQLGETDLERGYLNINEMIDQYRTLINTIKKLDKRCKIVLVSVVENEFHIQPGKFNSELYKLASETKCQYADITSASLAEVPQFKAFRSLRYFMTGSISLSEALEGYVACDSKKASPLNKEIAPSLS